MKAQQSPPIPHPSPNKGFVWTDNVDQPRQKKYCEIFMKFPFENLRWGGGGGSCRKSENKLIVLSV